MNRLRKVFAIASVSAAMMFSGTAHAMEIRQFDRMAAQDRQDYMNFLVEGAQKVLIAQGQRDDAAKVYQLFHEIHPGDTLSIGEAEFEGNLDNARVADAERHARDPNARRLEVEDALFVTLKKNGIILPRSIFTVAKDFKPKHSPEAKKK